MEISAEVLTGNSNLNFTLYPHQAAALEWARIIEYNIGNPNIMKGGILADDMGLGKTKTMVALIASNIVNSTLITTPNSTRYSWLRECLETLPSNIGVYTIEGDKYAKCSFIFRNGIKEINPVLLDTKKGQGMIGNFVLVANHELIGKGTKNDKLVTDLTYYRIISDEGHFLRHDNIDVYTKMNGIRHPVDRSCGFDNRIGTRWIVTGTPIQMDISDLLNIFKFIDGRFFTSRDRNINNQFMNNFILTNLFRRNRYQLTPFMKRIMKFPVSDPETVIEVVTMEETDLSRQLAIMPYENMHQLFSSDIQYVNAVMKDEKAFSIVLAAEIKAENLAHGGRTFTESENLRSTFSFPFAYIPKCISSYYPNNNITYQGKMSKLLKFRDIVASRNGESFVIFYHYNSIMKKLEDFCARVFPHYKVEKINGEVVSDRERDTIVQRCNKMISDDQPCFLLSSIMATAEGMNYQKFSNMITFDPEHNPKTEDQADSRINRIGQENLVNIWRLVLDDFQCAYGNVSIDIKIQTSRESKSHLSTVIDEINAAWTFKRYYFTNEDNQRESGVIFSSRTYPNFETLQHGTIGGPNSVGPVWIS